MARRTCSLHNVVLALTVLLNCSSDAMAVQNTLEGSKVVEYLRRLDDEVIASTTTTVPPAFNPPPKHPPTDKAPKKKPSNDSSSSAAASTSTTTTSSSSSKPANTPVKIHNDNDTDNSTSSKHDPNDHPGKKPVLLLLGSAAVGSLVIAAATYGRKKRRVEIQAHPLAGSLNRRMRMFQNLAVDRRSGSGSKGRGVLDEEVGEYRRAEGEALGIAVV